MKFLTQSFLILSALTCSASVWADPNAYRLSCSGDEPAWVITVKGDKVSGPSVQYSGAMAIEAAGLVPGNSFQISASDESKTQAILLSVIKAPCTVPSGETEPYTVLVRYEDHHESDVEVQEGCCKKL